MQPCDDRLPIVNKRNDPLYFFDESVMGRLLREKTWTDTALGEPTHWPSTLKSTLSILLRNHYPMLLFYGEEAVCFYNDNAMLLLSEGIHPAALGQPASFALKANWEVIKSNIDCVMKLGESTWHPDVQLDLERKDRARESHFNCSYSPVLDETGRIIATLVTFSETTEQIQLKHNLKKFEDEEALRLEQTSALLPTELQSHDDLRAAKAAAEQANQIKSEFLANMSHEIRTPLGAILGFTELLRDATTNQERAEYSHIIAKSGKVLTKLIDDILDLSKVEAGRMELEKISFRLGDLVDEILCLFESKAQRKRLAMEVHYESGVPEIIESDPSRLRQILTNIIGNAVKFTDQGKIVTSIALRADKGKRFLEFTVRDSGIGMSQAEAARLFEPFAQADRSTSRKYGGSGLGLVLSRRLARALGGDVSVLECSPNMGTSFLAFIELSVAAVPDQISGKPAMTSGARAGAEAFPFEAIAPWILLVDDSRDNQLLVKRILTKANMQVDVAGNGREALEMASRKHYDIILMDMQMPVMDGYQASEQLRTNGYRRPIIALTAHAMESEHRRIIEVGCDLHLTKPLDSRLLVQAIRDFVNRKAAGSQNTVAEFSPRTSARESQAQDRQT